MATAISSPDNAHVSIIKISHTLGSVSHAKGDVNGGKNMPIVLLAVFVRRYRQGELSRRLA